MVKMAQGKIDVTFKAQDAARIPDILAEGALSLLDLQRRGVLSSVGEQLKINRQGGFSGLDVWLVLWLYFATGTRSGLKKFWKVAKPHARQLAALAGRRELASPASVSRALVAVELKLLRPAAGALLTGIADMDKVLKHPAVQSYDTLGEGWHAFDLDPTVTALRHRALPASKELPEKKRRSQDTGAPGHKGRKRGDIMFRRTTVQHAGSGLWVHAQLSEGNGDSRTEFARALDSVVVTCNRLGHPLNRALVRMDGEYGNVPWYTACRERSLPFVTRLNRSKLYEDTQILARLREATFHEVEDSQSGPQRAAADLGVLTLAAGARTRRPDGGRYEPLNIRIVASVFQKTSAAKRGRTIDGWQVELFAVDLPADAWPATEAICTYYGRNGQENRFAQEDRELGLDRIVSYHLPGQELATLVGLSLWNLRVVRGFELERPPATRPVQRLRQSRVDERIPREWPRDPVQVRLLEALNWPKLLAGKRGWTFDVTSGELRCVDSRPMVLTTVRKTPSSSGLVGLIFRRPKGGCEACTARPGCLRAERPQASKHAEFAAPPDVAEQLRSRLALTRGKTDEPGIALQSFAAAPGPRAVHEALFLPAVARALYRELFRGSTLRAEVDVPRQNPRPRLLAVDVASRQRRRKTWEERVGRYALPEDARVSMEVAGSIELRHLLGDEWLRKAGVGEAG